MTKIVITNLTFLSDMDALWLVMGVVKGGKISTTKRGRQYYFASTTKKHVIYATLTKSGTHHFRIQEHHKDSSSKTS